jgi:hypothetical protein
MVPFFRNRSSLVTAFCMLTSLLCVAQQAASDSADDQAPLFLSFQVPGSTATLPQSINDLMVVTGSYYPTSGGIRGFVRYGDGSIITFAVPGAFGTQPASINDAGEITGSYQMAPTPSIFSSEEGFVRAADGTITTFGNSPYGIGVERPIIFLPLVINAAGEVVGYENDGLGERGFRRFASGTLQEFAVGPGGTIGTMMTGINASGAIVGLARNQNTPGFQGFLWSGKGAPSSPVSDTVPIIVDGSLGTEPVSINAEGTIAGCYLTPTTPFDFVRDPEGRITKLYIPGATQEGCDIYINDAGTIVSSFNTSGPIEISGFIKARYGDIIPFRYPGATMTLPTGLNNSDVVTGYYTKELDNVGSTGFIFRPRHLGYTGPW